MKELENRLNLLKQEMEEMKTAWAKEVKAATEEEGDKVYSKKLDKAFDRIAERYAEQMNDNLFAQRKLEYEIAMKKEEERKKLYKD